MNSNIHPLKAVSKPRNSRRLKVYYANYPHMVHNSQYPVIRIAGKYLESFGFEIGSVFRIDLSPGRIILQKEED